MTSRYNKKLWEELRANEKKEKEKIAKTFAEIKRLRGTR